MRTALRLLKGKKSVITVLSDINERTDIDMNSFSNMEDILGGSNIQHLNSTLEEFLAQSRIIRDRLGKQSYIFDRYLALNNQKPNLRRHKIPYRGQPASLSGGIHQTSDILLCALRKDSGKRDETVHGGAFRKVQGDR